MFTQRKGAPQPRRVPITAAVMGVAVLMIVGLPALATAPCSDSQILHLWDGVQESYLPSSSYAARATITERIMFLCSNVSGATSASAAYTMLTGSGSNDYAQIGYAKIAGSATSRFWEYNDGESTWNRQTFGAVSAGSTHTNSVVYSFTTGKVSMVFDGVTKQTTPFSIEFGEWATPWEGQWGGETWDHGDDIAGTASGKASFRSVGVVIQRDGPYVNPRNPYHATPPSYYKFQWVTQPSFDVWTQR